MSARESPVLSQWSSALDRFEEAMKVDPAGNSLAIDGSIQRFEFCFELTWKSLKVLLKDQGIEARSPKEALKAAHSIGWIVSEPAWLNMLEDRNLSTRTYNEVLAGELYARLPSHLAGMQSLLARLTAAED